MILHRPDKMNVIFETLSCPIQHLTMAQQMSVAASLWRHHYYCWVIYISGTTPEISETGLSYTSRHRTEDTRHDTLRRPQNSIFDVHQVHSRSKNRPNPVCTVPELPWARPWSRFDSGCPIPAWHIALRPNTGPLNPFRRTSEVHHVRPGPKNRPNPLCIVPETLVPLWVQLSQSCLTHCVKTNPVTAGPLPSDLWGPLSYFVIILILNARCNLNDVLEIRMSNVESPICCQLQAGTV